MPTKTPKKPKEPSSLERAFDALAAVEGFPPAEPDYVFHHRRRWQLDRAWPRERIAVELEGGVWSRTPGRHTRGAGFVEDCRKYNTAAIYGWLLLRFTVDDLADGIASSELRAAFRVRALVDFTAPPAPPPAEPQGGADA